MKKSLQSIIARAFDDNQSTENVLNRKAKQSQEELDSMDQEKQKEKAKLDHQFEKSQYYANKALDAQEKMVCPAFEYDEWRVNTCLRCKRHVIQHYEHKKPKKLAREQQKRREATNNLYFTFSVEAQTLQKLEEVEKKLGIISPLSVAETDRRTKLKKKKRKSVEIEDGASVSNGEEDSSSNDSVSNESNNDNETDSSRRRRRASGLSSRSKAQRSKPLRVAGSRRSKQSKPENTLKVVSASSLGSSALSMLPTIKLKRDSNASSGAAAETTISASRAALERLELLEKAFGLSTAECLDWLLGLGEAALRAKEDKANRGSRDASDSEGSFSDSDSEVALVNAGSTLIPAFDEAQLESRVLAVPPSGPPVNRPPSPRPSPRAQLPSIPLETARTLGATLRRRSTRNDELATLVEQQEAQQPSLDE